MSAEATPSTPAAASTLQKVRLHLRLYESAQILIPGLVGLLGQRVLPGPGLLVLYVIAYFSHVLSVYSFNDLCDYEADALNPRKAGRLRKSATWLRNQTVALTAVFVVSVAFLPGAVRALFVLSQLVCMAYSHPGLRLKRRLLGSEFAHFLAGASYFMSGVLLVGGDAPRHWLGAVVFGLLYLSGGTFNEVMDCDADRQADLRHLVVRAGRRRSLALVAMVHYAALALLAVYVGAPWMYAACAAAAVPYTVHVRRVAADVDDAPALLRFRRAYRLLFAILLSALCLTHVAAVVAG